MAASALPLLPPPSAAPLPAAACGRAVAALPAVARWLAPALPALVALVALPALLALTALLTSLAAPISAMAAEPLTLFTEDYAPFNWTDKTTGKPTGLSVDIVSELMLRAGLVATTPQVLPWARGLMLTGATARSCLYSTARTPERESGFQWIGPIARNDWVLFARQADHIVLRRLDDARPYQVGTFIGDAVIPLLQAHGLQVSIAASHRLNPPKLQMGRIQLWSVGRLPGLYLARELGISDIEPVLSFVQLDMYLACNNSMGRAETARLNEILRGMYHDGTVQRIYSRHGYERDTPRLDGAGATGTVR